MLKQSMSQTLNLQGDQERVKKTLCGRDIDIFWNNTLREGMAEETSYL